MSRAQQLAQKLGQNMNASLGVRMARPGEDGAVAKAIPMTSPEDGRTRDRLAGHMELDRIIPDPDQPRKSFPEESIAHLAESLKAAGQLQPIRVRWNEHHARWIIISGERRYRAAIMAGLKTIACQFVDRPLTEAEILQESLIENLLREDLLPIEAAQGYRQLMDFNGWTIQQVAEALNVTKGTVSKSLALLRLPEDIQAQVNEGDISPSAAYEVSRLAGEGAQRQLATRIVTEGLKRDEAGAVVGKASRPKAKDAEAKPSTTKVLNAGGARLTITWPVKAVQPEDVIAVLEDALAQVRSECA